MLHHFRFFFLYFFKPLFNYFPFIRTIMEKNRKNIVCKIYMLFCDQSKYRNGANAWLPPSSTHIYFPVRSRQGFVENWKNYEISLWNAQCRQSGKQPKLSDKLFVPIIKFSEIFAVLLCWRGKTHQEQQCAIEQLLFSNQKSSSSLLCWKCYSDDYTEENQRNVIPNVRTFMRRPITTQNPSKKGRVNLTFINEHCSRMSILLNMGHKNLSTSKWNILSLLGSCSKGHFYSRHSRSILTFSSSFLSYMNVFVGVYTVV